MTKVQAIKAEIERRIKSCKTKNGFPAGTISAIRIEIYEGLIAFIDSLPEEKEVKMNNESVIAETIVPLSIMDETIVPLSIMDETIYDAAPMLVKQQLAQAVGLRLLHEGFLDFDVQKFDFNRTRVLCKLSFYDLKKR